MTTGRAWGQVVVVVAATLAVVVSAAAVPAVLGSQTAPARSLVELGTGSGAAESLSGGGFGALSAADGSRVGGTSGTGPLQSQDAAVHFVVESNEPAYWRTGSFDRYTGQGWERTGGSRSFNGTVPRGELRGQRVEYRVQLKRSATALPTAWRPARVSLSDGVRRQPGNSLSTTEGLAAGTTYEGVSYSPARDPSVLRSAGDSYPAAVERRYLGLPDEPGTDRLAAFTGRLTSDTQTAYDTAVRIERYLESNKTYSLNASHDPDEGTVASQFVFEMETGYCEYFATAMVAMLRSQGIPARYVVGYSTGQETAPGEYTVRAMNAHAWVEAYFPSVGWVRFDPTPGSERLAAEQAAFANQTNADASAYQPTETGSPGESFSPNGSSGAGSQATDGATPTGTPSGAPAGTSTGPPSATDTPAGTTPSGTLAGTETPAGTGDGTPPGAVDGTSSGTVDGTRAGTVDGTSSGTPAGTVDGTPDGTPTEDGTPDGTPSGTEDGTPDGTPSGTEDGTPDGTPTEGAPPSGTEDGTPTGTDDSSALNVSLNRTAVPGATVTVRVTRRGEPVEGVSVLFNDRQIGTTDDGGRVVGRVPYAATLEITVVRNRSTSLIRPVGVSQAESHGVPPLGSLSAVTDRPPDARLRQDNNTTSQQYTLDTRANVSVVGTPRVNATVTVVASVADVPIRNATVRLDGQPVGRTDARGRVSLRLPAEPGNYTLSVQRDAVAGNRTVVLIPLRVNATVAWPLAVPFVPVAVTASEGGEPLGNATVAVNGQRLASTGPGGRATVRLPLAAAAEIAVTDGGRRATTTVGGIYLSLAGTLLAVVGVAGGAAVVVRRREESLSAVATRLARRAVAALVGLAAAVDSLLTAIRAAIAARDPSALVAQLREFAERTLVGLRLWLAATVASVRSSTDTPAPDEQTESATNLRRVWRQFLAAVSIGSTTTRTPGEVARWAVDRDGLPAEPVRQLRDAYRAVEYGGADPASVWDRVRDAVAALFGGDDA